MVGGIRRAAGHSQLALAGLDRLRRQNSFTQSEVCETALAEYRTENNPACMFLFGNLPRITRRASAVRRPVPAIQGVVHRERLLSAGGSRVRKRGPASVPQSRAARNRGRGSRLYAYCGLAADGLSGFGG